MKITTTKKDNVTIISFDGKLDSNSSSDATEEVLPLISSGIKLIMDMEKCSYLSSAGLRVLMMIGKTLSRENGVGVLSGLNSELQDIMEMTGFGSVFKNFDNLIDATKYLENKND